MADYLAVSRESSVELTINKSRFIGQCFPADAEQKALTLLDETRKRYRDANHNCYAYSIGGLGGFARFSDDGEPSGTAGLPMMEAIKHKGVTDLLVVVTRYFGGVLLGSGGLVRAYSKAASMAIDRAEPVIIRECLRYILRMDYAMFAVLEQVLRSYGELNDTRYTEEVTVTLTVPKGSGHAFTKAVTERTEGKLSPQASETIYAAFPN